MRLAMTDRDVVERFHAWSGCGAVYERRPGTNGHKPLHDWVVQEAAEVRRLALLLLPFLGKRRTAQAHKALADGAHIKIHSGLRTHCPQGHEYTAENTEIENRTYKGRPAPRRRCKTCRNEQVSQRRIARAA